MGFSRLFVCFRKPKTTYSSKMIKLKSLRDGLLEKRESLQDRLSKFNDMCLKYVKENDRTNALFVLKRKALVSKQLSILDELCFKILQLISDTESANFQVESIRNLEIGNKLLSEISKELNRKDFDSFMESDKRNLEEISERLGMITRSYEIDDLELVQELDFLTNDMNSMNFDHNYPQINEDDQQSFDLDLSKLKSVSSENTYTNRDFFTSKPTQIMA
ncbi:Snf7 family protein [Theileria parva strain Muguga]|uniref:Snf7 family protein n=1 Tax=Theileria parva strain Muguga TaxID=333668 RepID=UPI001C61FF2E|nr:Snf7 family protein [Theileria parva strain Muguga]EAN30632.2 Snf7 family protein [Theileria parva strain Muguga]